MFFVCLFFFSFENLFAFDLKERGSAREETRLLVSYMPELSTYTILPFTVNIYKPQYETVALSPN